MKLKRFWATAALLATLGTAMAAQEHEHGHGHEPMHGGVVVEASDMDFELVAKADVVTLYLRDHGKPAITKGGSGKITLLSGSDKTEATLVPAGDNKLEAKGSFKVASGTKAVAMVTLPGKKAINVRFALK
ncbi:hypothetical protein [Azohydromonas caseinilytica]|uniref:DUF4198 domain-containing protein n=1 Tax=Azohydromonas caseinilytica TaxID=2728836 RepID=A0A848FCM7_9BURK|nr:hypothetical protein [Azohydromonas caseinilytica]NML17078.1 hypothetical protein [Azohydromonas caseinilytica]